ncbi:MAG: NADPH-dependent F420 reductase [Parvibaculaceae bacterium]
MTKDHVIAVLGGTGNEGSGLALRFANAGYRVVIGSRDPGKAAATAGALASLCNADHLSGADNTTAAKQADIVILTVPYAAQRTTIEDVRDQLTGKILIDATVPLVPPRVSRVQLPDQGSAVAGIQALLGDKVRVVSAFQNVSAHHLKDLSHEVECDVLVCGDDAAAKDTVLALIAAIGLRGVNAGPIANSAAAEALTSILISLNARYKSAGTGIRITGLPAKQAM